MKCALPKDDDVTQGGCGCPAPGCIQGQAGCGSVQPGLVVGDPAHGWRPAWSGGWVPAHGGWN